MPIARIIAAGLLAASSMMGAAVWAPAEAQPRFGARGPNAGVFAGPRPGWGGGGWRGPGYAYGWRRPSWGWGWPAFGVGLGLGLGLGLPWYAPAYPYAAYPYYPPEGYAPYGYAPYPPPGYPAGVKPGEPWGGAPASPWAAPEGTAMQCRAGPVSCGLPVALEPGTACSCPGGRRGEIWGRAQ